MKGQGDQIDYGMRIYDPRVGKFLSIDPLQKQYPWLTPYQFASNSPVANVDLDGLESKFYVVQINTYTGQNIPKLFQPTTDINEDYNKERQISGMGIFGNGHGNLGKGTLVTIYQTDAIIKDGQLIKTSHKIGDLYIPTEDEENSDNGKNKQSTRGGLYLVSKSGGYFHADGEPEGDDLIPIPIDLLTKVVGGFPDNESAIEAAKDIFTADKMGDRALSVLETINTLHEAKERVEDINEALKDLIKEMGSKTEVPMPLPPVRVPGEIPAYGSHYNYYMRDKKGNFLESEWQHGPNDSIVPGKNGVPDTIFKRHWIPPPTPKADIPKIQ